MKEMLFTLVAVVTTFLSIGLTFWYCNKGIIVPYGKIFEIKNFNTVGKIILCIIATPFTIIPTALMIVVNILFYGFAYATFCFRWLFAENRKEIYKEYFGETEGEE